MPHADAEHEWSFLLALSRGVPTKVFTGLDAVKLACDLLGITQLELACCHGCDFIKAYAPLLLPRQQLEKLMVPVGGECAVLQPGDLVVLPPKQVHETPKTMGTESRAMLFFTIVLQSKADVEQQVKPTALYDPKHQYLPFDIIGKIVTHNFFPQKCDECIDILFKSHLEWATHEKYIFAKARLRDTVRRLEDITPRANASATTKLVDAIRKMLDARKEGQNTTWTIASLTTMEDSE